MKTTQILFCSVHTFLTYARLFVVLSVAWPSRALLYAPMFAILVLNRQYGSPLRLVYKMSEFVRCEMYLSRRMETGRSLNSQ